MIDISTMKYPDTFCQVDDEDYELLVKWRWHASCISGHLYAARNTSRVNGKHTSIRMHRLIMETPKGMDTDHIDGDKLNNQRHNLRVCTHAENTRNVRKRTGTTSQYKGVYWSSEKKRFCARVKKLNGKPKLLGTFRCEKDAALAYNAGAKEYYGEYARLNEVS